MSTTTPSPTPPEAPRPRWHARVLAHPATYVLMGGGILMLDLLTGPFLQFPILFILPVALSAWFYSPRWAYSLAVLLPAGRFLIAAFVDTPSPLVYIAANAFTRVAVLAFLAFLVAYSARQTRALQERVAGFVTMCAWSRTIEYEGEWITFEQYLERRFDVQTTHGISPAERRKALGELKKP